MLQLARLPDGSFPDDADPALRWRLPQALVPQDGPDGSPQVLLARGPDGGGLHLRLRAQWPALAAHERPVAFEAGRFRLRLRTPAATEHGAWWPAMPHGDTVVERSLSLGPVEAAIARRLAVGGGDPLEVEVELEHAGRSPVWPWLVSADAGLLRTQLAALLGPQPVTLAQAQSACLGLDEALFTWHPLTPAALRPPRDEALQAIAALALPLLGGVEPEGYRLATGGPARLDLDLQLPRPARGQVLLVWSLSQFLAAQPDPARHLQELLQPGPLEAATLTLVNDLPLHADALSSLQVEVRTGGPTGLLTHEFRPGGPAAARLRYVRETFDDDPLQWRVRCSVMTAQGTSVSTSDYRRAATPWIELNAATTGLRVLAFEAEPALFAHASAFEIALGARTLTLTRATPTLQAVGRQPPAAVAVTAVTADGQRHPLGEHAIVDDRVRLDGGLLGLGDTVSIRLQPPHDLDLRAAYLAVQVDGGPWRSLEAGAELSWARRRDSRLAPPTLRYRTRHVPRRADGSTGPIVESAWRVAQADAGLACTVDWGSA